VAFAARASFRALPSDEGVGDAEEPVGSRGPNFRGSVASLLNRRVDCPHHQGRLVRMQAGLETHHAALAREQRDLAGLRCGALVGDLLDAAAQRLELGGARFLRHM